MTTSNVVGGFNTNMRKLADQELRSLTSDRVIGFMVYLAELRLLVIAFANALPNSKDVGEIIKDSRVRRFRRGGH